MKIGIISGVISSLIVVIFIQPILGFTWDVAVGIAGAIQQGYVDQIYRNAAIADRNLVGHMALMVLMLFLQFSSLVLLRSSFLPSPLVTMARSVSTTLGLGGLVISLVLLVAFSLSWGIMEIGASFTQRLTVLAPAISDTEHKTLKARWANMRTESDYKKINEDIENRANELAITLPPVRKP